MSGFDEAWQAALAAEYRAVYAYGVLGPQLADDRQELARTVQLAHADLRDATVAALLADGVTPAPPAADYPLAAVRDSAAATSSAAAIEDACAAAWRFLFAAAADGPAQENRKAIAVRRSAQQALTASAVRATRWRALDTPGRATTPFPGI